MFKTLKIAVQSNLNKMQQSQLFYVEVNKDIIYQLYLDGFTDDLKQEHTCNCCKSFLRQFGGIVTIVNNKMVSIWDNLSPPKEYVESVKNIKKYIHSLPIHSTFFNDYVNCGTDKNLDKESNVIWEHFHFKLDKKFIQSKDQIPTVNGINSTTQSVFKRALDELTVESVELVLELIDQNSLYRGKEFEANLKQFLKLKKEYAKVKKSDKDNYCWVKSLETSRVITNIRNSSIGTLLIDLSSGMELDIAVGRFEKVVAPTNYKRPTALVTQRMIEDAKKTLAELDLIDSLDRRYATARDISVDNLLFVDKTSEVQDVFGEISKETTVDIKKLSKVEEISIKDFVEKVIPKTKSMEVLLENKHLSNFVSVITSQNNTNKLFKWDNDFSWSYSGGITDSLKDKVVKAGGRVDGVFRFTHSWNEIEPNESLMDLHVFFPTNDHKTGIHNNYGNNNERIGWNHRKHFATGGVQDVDYVNKAPTGYVPVENITFPDLKKMPEGDYQCKIHNWSFRNSGGAGKAEIECGGNLYQYEYPRTKNRQWVDIATVNLKNGVFTVKHHLKEKSETINKWGLKTNTFVKVKQSMLSPNYWGNQVGNKHYMFMLENCISDESPRPFFNEFLKEELNSHRKVLEIVGSKCKIGEDKNQLSGLGFSETKKDSVIIRVNGAFKRVLKVNF